MESKPLILKLLTHTTTTHAMRAKAASTGRVVTMFSSEANQMSQSFSSGSQRSHTRTTLHGKVVTFNRLTCQPPTVMTSQFKVMGLVRLFQESMSTPLAQRFTKRSLVAAGQIQLYEISTFPIRFAPAKKSNHGISKSINTELRLLLTYEILMQIK